MYKLLLITVLSFPLSMYTAQAGDECKDKPKVVSFIKHALREKKLCTRVKNGEARALHKNICPAHIEKDSEQAVSLFDNQARHIETFYMPRGSDLSRFEAMLE